MSESESPILFERLGALALITLNRPAALNSLTRSMCRSLSERLTAWAEDDDVHSIVIRGTGARAFCAGGDIRAMSKSSKDNTPAASDFLWDEYQLNALIGAYPKNYIALINGIVMGGGAGLSIHGRYRVADDRLAFAMPETAIGFVPDVGSSYFLARCPGETGMYLALTGTCIGIGDAMAFGLVTHRIDASDHPALIEHLASGTVLPDTFEKFARSAPLGLLANKKDCIDRIFAASSVEGILEELEREGSRFAQETAGIIRSRCPVSLKLAFRLIREGKALPLTQCLRMEYRVAARRVMSPDFREGVRAALVDKDGMPSWRPKTLAEVSDSEVAAYFEPSGTRELQIS